MLLGSCWSRAYRATPCITTRGPICIIPESRSGRCCNRQFFFLSSNDLSLQESLKRVDETKLHQHTRVGEECSSCLEVQDRDIAFYCLCREDSMPSKSSRTAGVIETTSAPRCLHGVQNCYCLPTRAGSKPILLVSWFELVVD